MTTIEFKRRARAVFGGRGWMTKLAKGTGVGYQTVRRWNSGETPPPPLAQTVIVLLETMIEHGHPLPEKFR
jgi:hypothetical protein